MIRALVLLALLLASPLFAQVSPGDVTLTVEVEDLGYEPIAGEMVMVRIIGRYRLPITLEKLEQPELPGFDWMQLGSDLWREELDRGQPIKTLERRMALFPQESGELVIPPFTHNLTLLSRGGRRFDHKAVSNAVTLTATAQPEEMAWWFPVRSIEISDTWSNPPEALPDGAGALRVVVLTAHGAEPELIPPMPEMTAAGAYLFPHPEKRIVTLGPEGPITRVFWRWTVRPDEDAAGYLNPVAIRYFDSKDRTTKEISLAAQRVAFARNANLATNAPGAGVNAPAAAPPPRDAAGWSVAAPPVGLVLLVGFGLGLVAVLAQARSLSLSALRDRLARFFPPVEVSALRRAARAGDAAQVWAAGRKVLAQQERAPPDAFKGLERALFGSNRPAEPPDLRAIAVSLQRR